MISVDLKHGLYIPTHPKATVSQRFGVVVLKIGRGIMELTTTAAHGLGLGLIKKQVQAEKGDYIVLSINGVDVNLLTSDAKALGAKLLKYADDADDFQIGAKR
jgi:hypothetical protein